MVWSAEDDDGEVGRAEDVEAEVVGTFCEYEEGNGR